MPVNIADAVVLRGGSKMPWLGLGTWRSTGNEANQAVRWALEIGYRHIDTASAYGNEREVGAGVRASGVKRQDVFITTKLWNDDQRQGYDRCLAAFAESLKRLGTDYLDLYLLHWPVQGHFADSWRALEKLHRDGRARAIGVSNFMIHHLKELLKSATVVPMVNQVEFHPWLVQPELLDFCRKHDIVEEAWSPLIRGKVAEIPELQRLAGKYCKTPAQIALRWNMQHGVVTIPKSVHRARIEENSNIFDFKLTPQEMAAIDAQDRKQRVGPDPDNFAF
jgi:diketogulonate reductase-like aldo/keto reductase